MTELNKPNLNKKSEKYIFKKKLSLRRKSKSKLLIESLLMMLFSFFLIYINFLIPDKVLLFKNLLNTLNKSLFIVLDLFSQLYQVFLVLFMITSFIFVIILIFGSFYRVLKVMKRKTRQISFK